MNLIKIFTRYPDQESCIEQWKNVRWGDTPCCPHCGGVKVARKADATGSVVGLPLLQIQLQRPCPGRSSRNQNTASKWFLAIGLIVHAKKSISSCQLARDLGLTQTDRLVFAGSHPVGNGR